MDLSIVIVNWNSVDYLRACIASVIKQTHGIAYEIIVIDAASFDGSQAMVAGTYPSVHFIQGRRNVGFGLSNNEACKQARGEAILFLNPDTEVLGTAINDLHAALLRLPDAGGVGCRLLNSDGSLQTSCVQAFPTITNQMLDTEWLREKWPAAPVWGTGALYARDGGAKIVDGIAGACIMMRREVFEKVGGFSSDFFMYAEDIDLCHKVQAIGMRNYYLPDATIVHHGGGCSKEAPSDFAVVLMRESIFRYFAKTHGQVYGQLYRAAMLVVAAVRLGLLGIAGLRDLFRPSAIGRSGSVRKWTAVLRWCIARRATVRMFEPAA
ncbi:MAG: glycosyltransferase family 2 protein [Pseudomonadota bacterium]|nr:glycosyltransferase family 2 protein [Pseudomonadota bacterium]